MNEKPPLLLLSKLLAGGLSAGVVLVWWPVLSHSSGAGSWVLRGILWTCVFELLLLAFGPMEETLMNSRVLSRLRTYVPQPSSNRTIITLAIVTAVVCAGLVIKGPAAKTEAKPRPKIMQTIVKPVEVIRKTVVVEKPVPKIITKTQTKTITKIVQVPAPVVKQPTTKPSPVTKPVVKTPTVPKTPTAPVVKTPTTK